MEKEEITIELLYRKLENRLTEEEVKHFEMWMQDIDHQRYYRNLQSFYELREAGRPDSAEVNRAWIDLQSRINKQGLKPGRALRGTRLSAPDLRGGAALVLAALAAQGRSQIGGVAYLDRGYADFTEILASLGARIYRETKPA